MATRRAARGPPVGAIWVYKKGGHVFTRPLADSRRLLRFRAGTATRRLPARRALGLAAKADFLALIAFEFGLFGWVAITQLILFPAAYLPTDSAAFWFMMQIGMLIGFATTYPVNWWLIRRGIKDIM